MSFDLAICNGIIVTTNNCYKPFLGSIGISDGLIEYVGERIITPRETKKYIDAENKIVMPGLINGHCHAEMAFARGLGDDLTLEEQIQVFGEFNWFYDEISEEDRYYSRLLTYIEAILSGTTFILDNAFWDSGEKTLDAMQKVGIKGGVVNDFCDDFSRPDNFKSFSRLLEHRNMCNEKSILPVYGNMLEEDFTESGLDKIKTLSHRLNSLVTGHLSETQHRKDLVENKFKTSAVSLLNEHEILNPKYIGSHAIHLSDTDISILAENSVKIVNTPVCEMKIVDGIAPIRRMLDAGIVVGLGTDGAMWNNTNDLFREMKGMVLLHSITSGIRTLSSKSVLDMATIKGAKVFGLDGEIGSLEMGKKADIILIDTNQPHLSPIRLKNRENVSSVIVYCVTGRDVTDVIIEGKHLVQDRKLITIDVNDVLHRVSRISEKIEAIL